MKTKIILLGIIFFITTVTSYSQTGLDNSRVVLMKSSNTTVGLYYGQSIAKCIEILGQPTSITDYYSEMDNATMKFYKYGNNTVKFLGGYMVGFEINDNTLKVGKANGTPIFKVGDKMEVYTVQVLIDPGPHPRYRTDTRYRFHDFPLSMGGGVTRGKTFRSISLSHLRVSVLELDVRFELLFNSNNDLICISMLN